jgi:hypothetical protein
VLAALGLALFWDPFFDPNCWANRSDNAFLLRSLPRLARGIGVADRWFTVAAAAALVTVYAWRLLWDPGPARRPLLPVTLPALLLAATVIAHAIALQRRPLEDPSDPAFSAIFVIGCVLVLLLAAGLGWATVRTRVQRRAAARIATSLGQAPPPGSLQAALAKAVGDPELQIAYWLPAAQRHVDADGKPVAEPAAGPGRAITALVRDGRQIALVTHTAAPPDLERELGAAVRLALDNERLQAEVLDQLDQLRASRVRIVETGDTVAEGRYPPAVETAAYLLVAEALDDAARRDASYAAASLVQDGGRLVVTVEDDGTRRTATMVQVADRVGALDGRLEVEPTRLRVELPCG